MIVRHADRFGLTWHPSLAPGVLANLDRVDLLEVIPEGRFLESRRARRALRRLARAVPVSIHGVSLGLAGVSRVSPRRLEHYARLIGDIEPESWSEHLAFVRAGEIELGHLAAPPRGQHSIEATAEHVELARRAIGSYPSLENVATPLEPPESDRSEEEWLLDVLAASPIDLLLDLHNLYTNGANFGFDPAAVIRVLPADRIRTIHIAGGVEVEVDGGERRRIDDHRHDVPDPVYELLTLVGELVPHPIDVVLERDGAFPPFAQMLAELDRARAALAQGRARSNARFVADVMRPVSPERAPDVDTPDRCESAAVEHFLARLFTDSELRSRHRQSVADEAVRAGLSPATAQRISRLDATGLELAAATFASKRRTERPRAGTASRWSEFFRARRHDLT
jgi:uncharacterized protein (UPF0276 family)